MYPTNVDYLNLEYILTRSYDFVSGFHWSAAAGAAPGWAVALLTVIVIVGMSVALLLVLLIVYSQIRLLQVEHAGFHAMETHAAEAHQEAVQEKESGGQTERWKNIEELSLSPNHGDWRRAILEADIMLSDALAQAGYTAPTVGEQLKLTNPLQVTSVRAAWDAHMLRNKIAHGGESLELSARDVQTAIQNYRKVFTELGFI